MSAPDTRTDAVQRRDNALAAKLTAELYALHFGVAVAVEPNGAGEVRLTGRVAPPTSDDGPLPDVAPYDA